MSIIGAGFSGISAAAYLARQGYQVHVFEKNAEAGGRARQLTTPEGFVFDMGPSWYWMPGIFEKFFNDFGYRSSDFYQLQLLDPSFEMVFGKNETLVIPADFKELCKIFESIETGGSAKLKRFMREGELKYRLGMEDLVYKPSLSITEYFTSSTIRNSLRFDLFVSFSRHVRKYFSDPRLIALMEFPVLFLGAKPTQIPALYSLMNYAGLKLGTWYPIGGFGKVIAAMKNVAEENGAEFHLNAEVEKIIVGNGLASGLRINDNSIFSDGIVATADYHHVEESLLSWKDRNYQPNYWKKKILAPSCLIFYLGINKTIKRLHHHTLFFDEDLEQHSYEIYTEPQWPSKPLFYACCPSKTDPTVAPAGHENIFLLMPIAAGLDDDGETRQQYFSVMIKRLEEFVNESIQPNIVFKKSYCINNFVEDYHSYKGNAYGLANTLLQTAILKPKIKNRKLKNLFYAGQLTVPGPGVPPSIISGRIAAGLLSKYLAKKKDEVVV